MKFPPLEPELFKEGLLKIWYMPNVPGETFEIYIDSLKEGKEIIDILSQYDLFLLNNDLREDFANVTGIVMLEKGIDLTDSEKEKLSKEGVPEGLAWYDVDESEWEDCED